jgi:hypothetical protein
MKRIITLTLLLFILLSCFCISVFAGNHDGEKKTEKQAILVYPKITEGIIYIDGVAASQPIIIENGNGTQLELKQIKYNGYNAIDLSEFETGIYKILINTEANSFIETVVKH